MPESISSGRSPPIRVRSTSGKARCARASTRPIRAASRPRARRGADRAGAPRRARWRDGIRARCSGSPGAERPRSRLRVSPGTPRGPWRLRAGRTARIRCRGRRRVGTGTPGHVRPARPCPASERRARGSAAARARRGRRVAQARSEQDWTSRGLEQRFVLRPQVHDASRRREVARQGGERLGRATFRHTQAPHGRDVVRSTRELETTQAVDGRDASGEERGAHEWQRALVVGQPGAIRALQGELRTAGRTAHRLGVETTIADVFVLAPARRAQREARHRSALAIEGERTDDREARPAVRARRERVAMSSIARIVELGAAGRAQTRVGRDERVLARAGGGGLDTELALAGRGQGQLGARVDARQGRQLDGERGSERGDVRERGLGVRRSLPSGLPAGPAPSRALRAFQAVVRDDQASIRNAGRVGPGHADW